MAADSNAAQGVSYAGGEVEVMKKTVTKLTVLAVAMALVAGCAFTGCGKKTVDYTLDDGKSGGEESEGSTAGRLGIPKSYTGTVDGIDGATGLTKVSIDAKDISGPDSGEISTVYLEKKVYTNEDKKRICENFFDTSAGIYVYDSEHPYKGDVDKNIEYWKQKAESAQSDEEKSSYDEIIQSYKDQLKDSVAEREGAGDYSGESFSGQVGGNEFVIYFYGADEGGLGAGFYIQYNGASMLSYRSKDGAADVSSYVSSGGDTQNMTNKASISQQEAEQRALDFLSMCGITDIIKTGTSDVWWDYYDSSYGVMESETYGYDVKFERSIGGVSPYSAYIWSVDGMGDGYAYYSDYTETFDVEVDDNGIFNVACIDNFKFSEDKAENTGVITWKEALEALPKAINTWYAAGSSYSTITFNDVRLSYYLMSDGDGYKYVPVYVFAECEEYDGVVDEQYPIHLIMLDAVTGELINLRDAQEGVGTTYDSLSDTTGDGTEAAILE